MKFSSKFVVVIALASLLGSSVTSSSAFEPAASSTASPSAIGSLTVTAMPSADWSRWTISWTGFAGASNYQIRRATLSPINGDYSLDFVANVPATSRTYVFQTGAVATLGLPSASVSARLSGALRELFVVEALGVVSGVAQPIAKGVAQGPCPEFALVGVRGTSQNPDAGNIDGFGSGLGNRGVRVWQDMQTVMQKRFPAVPAIYAAWPNMGDVKQSIDSASKYAWWSNFTAAIFLTKLAAEFAGYSVGYGTSVQNGVNMVNNAVDNARKACPSIKLILVGYSQGSEVVGDWLQSGAAVSGVVRHSILFADARFNDLDSAVQYPSAMRGKYAPGGISSLLLKGKRPVFASPNRVHSWCWAGDLVCVSSPTNLYRRNFHTESSTSADYYACYEKWARYFAFNAMISRSELKVPSNPQPGCTAKL